jgi:hypothetical protein
MSRCMTLEEYLERFVDENTQSAGDEITLVVSDAEAQTLGLFFINGITGYIACVRNDRGTSQTTSTSEDEQNDLTDGELPVDQDDLIN